MVHALDLRTGRQRQVDHFEAEVNTANSRTAKATQRDFVGWGRGERKLKKRREKKRKKINLCLRLKQMSILSGGPITSQLCFIEATCHTTQYFLSLDPLNRSAIGQSQDLT